MGEQHSYGLLIASVVAIVAIVGLVVLFSKTSATGAMSHVQLGGGRVSLTPQESSPFRGELEQTKRDVKEQIYKLNQDRDARLKELENDFKSGRITGEQLSNLRIGIIQNTLDHIKELNKRLNEINQLLSPNPRDTTIVGHKVQPK